jgi:general secretion pathway protein L
MPDRLLLRLDSAGDPSWLRQGTDGRAAAGSTRGWPPAAAIAGAGEIVVLVPAEDVLLTEARVTAKSRAQLMQALPFAVEDQLLAPVEDSQFAATEGAGDAVGVAVVSRATLRTWLERLAANGIRADALLPESLAVPIAPDRATALVENDRVLVRLAPSAAFVCAPSGLAAWMQRASSDGTARSLDVFDFRDGATARIAVPATSYHERQRDPLAFLARSLRKPPLNLLDGEFAPQHHAARGARWWRVAAALAAAVVALAVLDLGFEVLQLSRTSARLDAAAQDAVRKAFPDVDGAELARATPGDIARRRIERLRGGSESSGFLRVLNEIGPVLGTTTQIQTRAIEFRNGTLELGLRAPDVATLDAVRERLAAQPGLSVTVTAANPGESGIDGRIRIVSSGIGNVASGGGAK